MREGVRHGDDMPAHCFGATIAAGVKEACDTAHEEPSSLIVDKPSSSCARLFTCQLGRLSKSVSVRASEVNEPPRLLLSNQFASADRSLNSPLLPLGYPNFRHARRPKRFPFHMHIKVLS